MALIAAAIVLTALASPIFAWSASSRADRARFQLETSSFRNGEFIPRKYTCSGSNLSPALAWTNPPARTQSFVLIMYDPDAPGGTWVHWVVYNIPAKAHGLAAGVPANSEVEGQGMQGINSFEKIGYGGPCPPPGKVHHYHIALYSLDTRVPLKPGATRAQVERAMKGHILGKAELVGLYRR